MGCLFFPKLLENTMLEETNFKSLCQKFIKKEFLNINKGFHRFYCVYSDGRFPEEDLINNLTTGRNPNARPSMDPLQAINISLTLSLNSIVNVNEVTGTLTTRITLQIRWLDFSLAWNISTFKGISKIQMKTSDVWTPDLVIFNSLTSSPLDKENSVTNNGFVSWTPNFLLDTSCKISVAKFPFDSQICEIQVGPWFHDTNSQYITNGNINSMKLSVNGVWDLTGTNYTSFVLAQAYQASVFKLFLSRRPSYDILHMFCPVILLSVMNLFVFLMPYSSGEKISFCLSIFLTFSVLLASLKAELPVTSLEMPYFGIFVFFQFCLGGIESCVSVLILRLSCRPERDKIPKYLRNVCSFLCLIPAQNHASAVSPIEDSKYVLASHEDKVQSTSENYSNKKDNNDTNNDIKNINQTYELSWDDIASGMDKLCFFVFTGIKSISYRILYSILLMFQAFEDDQSVSGNVLKG
ncbi:LOW QUALITY PROTEIN: hypothetical protein KUTeg_014757 [Tegillarca granosa]|uniref:Uncharacterized protein n=1 Tax=Tegillarca granosa TaxID=220873 RepID=A0ABQ9EVU2_TEGGR|nr:LOW QUALITY PROTEIN: hypothetical protein KUTeg_014757 [Tegillarca granosa]